MDDKIDTAEKKVLVDIVKLVQKKDMKGKLGGWKEFLKNHDKKFGAGLSDPSKRSHEVLAEFLKTFSTDEDLKFFDNIMQRHSNQYTLERPKDRSHDSPEQVSESKMSKLLIHKIPTTVNSETLHEIVPGDFTIEQKPARRDHRDKYSVLAIFKSQREALEAYENVQGSQEKDSNGLQQKLVTCRLSTGIDVSVYVRKMGIDNHHKKLPSKRDLPEEDKTLDTFKNKKLKMDPEVEKDDALKALRMKHEIEKKVHLKEIEALNQRLKERELEQLNEIEALNQRLKENELEIESMKEQLLNQRSKESELEIESIKEQLRKKDFEINNLHRMVDNIKKRQKPRK
ncbi:unnamed protein product [Vicia faba]|uniref:Uncharacterized protein n=1 Tax=Vicia faba TaxID=3906 RepID=A0AAV0Z342_VICFA|nr:unnamed protein product [Vicia faba]